MKDEFGALKHLVEIKLIEKISEKKFTDGEYEELIKILAILVGGKK